MGGRGIYCAPFYQGNCLFHMGMVWGVEGYSLVVFIFLGGVVLPGLGYPCPDLLWFYLSWVGRLSCDFPADFLPSRP